jgi:hypothetical protein
MEANPIIIQCYQNVISYIKKRVINYIFDRKLLTWYAIFNFVLLASPTGAIGHLHNNGTTSTSLLWELWHGSQ